MASKLVLHYLPMFQDSPLFADVPWTLDLYGFIKSNLYDTCRWPFEFQDQDRWLFEIVLAGRAFLFLIVIKSGDFQTCFKWTLN